MTRDAAAHTVGELAHDTVQAAGSAVNSAATVATELAKRGHFLQMVQQETGAYQREL